MLAYIMNIILPGARSTLRYSHRQTHKRTCTFQARLPSSIILNGNVSAQKVIIGTRLFFSTYLYGDGDRERR